MRKLLILIIPLVLMALLLSGCYTEEESAYRVQVGKAGDRWETLSEKAEKAGKAMEEEAKAITTPESAYALIDKYNAEFTADLNEARAIQNEFAAVTPPKRFETAHAQYNTGMIQEIVSVETRINSLTEMRNNPSYFTFQAVETTVANSEKLSDQAVANCEDANGKVFRFPYDILVIGIVASLLFIGLVTFAIIMLSRRRRRPAVSAPQLPTTCRWCGATIPPNSPYCPKCGRTIGSFT